MKKPNDVKRNNSGMSYGRFIRSISRVFYDHCHTPYVKIN